LSQKWEGLSWLLDERGDETLVIVFEGEVVLRDAVPKPRMSEFVDDNVYQGSVASQESYTYISEFMVNLDWN